MLHHGTAEVLPKEHCPYPPNFQVNCAKITSKVFLQQLLHRLSLSAQIILLAAVGKTAMKSLTHCPQHAKPSAPPLMHLVAYQLNQSTSF